MKKLAAIITAIVTSLFVATAPVMAVSPSSKSPSSHFVTFGADVVDHAILDKCAQEEADKGNGAGVVCIIQLVIDILTVGIGIVGAIGISVSGIQYLTAGGNEEQTRKAKRRIFEIVIGFAAYALIYLALSFLLPSFSS